MDHHKKGCRKPDKQAAAERFKRREVAPVDHHETRCSRLKNAVMHLDARKAPCAASVTLLKGWVGPVELPL
jgi:hypothetical protein